MTPEEKSAQCRQAVLSAINKLTPEERKKRMERALAARWGPKDETEKEEDKELKQLEKLQRAASSIKDKKHEGSGPDPAKVCRAVGLGEIDVLKGVKTLAEKSKSDVVRLRAYELACKVLRMIREDTQQNEGVRIIIQALEGSQQVNITPPGQTLLQEPASYNHPQPSSPGKPIQMVK